MQTKRQITRSIKRKRSWIKVANLFKWRLAFGWKLRRCNHWASYPGFYLYWNLGNTCKLEHVSYYSLAKSKYFSSVCLTSVNFSLRILLGGQSVVSTVKLPHNDMRSRSDMSAIQFKKSKKSMYLILLMKTSIFPTSFGITLKLDGTKVCTAEYITVMHANGYT